MDYLGSGFILMRVSLFIKVSLAPYCLCFLVHGLLCYDVPRSPCQVQPLNLELPSLQTMSQINLLFPNPWYPIKAAQNRIKTIGQDSGCRLWGRREKGNETEKKRPSKWVKKKINPLETSSKNVSQYRHTFLLLAIMHLKCIIQRRQYYQSQRVWWQLCLVAEGKK